MAGADRAAVDPELRALEARALDLRALEVDAMAELTVQFRALATHAAARAQSDRRAAEAIRVVPIQPQGAAPVSGAFTISSASNVLGPNTGYAWAVQSLSVAGLGSADTASLYIGPATATAVAPNNFKQAFTAAAPAWQPGRTGLILNQGDTLVLAGTGLTSPLVTLTGQVIVMESWLLPLFLL